MKNISLRMKLLVIGIFLTGIPLVVVFLISVNQGRDMAKVSLDGATEMAYTDLDHVLSGVYAMCAAQQEVLQKMVNNGLNVARRELELQGDVSFAEETQSWRAANQYSQAEEFVELPAMVLGETQLGQNYQMEKYTPVVDDVMKQIGVTSTIFQRMNNRGDMLRVATSVLKQDGSRAIGTYIPRTNPDGTANPVVETLLAGNTYRGRAFVVDKWYITAYEPVFDNDRNVIGALYVGIPQESTTALRKEITAMTVGQTGYVYVLDSDGNYVISKGGERDGENVFDAKDADGDFVIRTLITKAKEQPDGGIGEHKYSWLNPGDEKARMKIARLMYFEPWDWTIGVGSYEHEFYHVNEKIAAINKAGSRKIIMITIAAIGLAFVIWFIISGNVAGDIAKRINKVVTDLLDTSHGLVQASSQISGSSQALAERSSEQAASVEEVSSSVEELSAMAMQNGDNSEEASKLAKEAKISADAGSESIEKMIEAMAKIKESSSQTSKIIKTIDEIAFQTNLLALNAAVEAARAGEAGKGFAVVASEVRNLAQRSAKAARNTTELIESSVTNTEYGAAIADELVRSFNDITERTNNVAGLLAEIEAASKEQAKGITFVNQSVTQIDRLTQENAGTSEDSATAAEEMNVQAEGLSEMVDQLAKIIGGKKKEARQFRKKEEITHSGFSKSFDSGNIREQRASNSNNRSAIARVNGNGGNNYGNGKVPDSWVDFSEF